MLGRYTHQVCSLNMPPGLLFNVLVGTSGVVASLGHSRLVLFSESGQWVVIWESEVA